MREIVAITHVSLDGVMQAPGGPEEDRSGGFTSGGWTVPYRDDSGGKAIADIVAVEFDMLLGRRTYDNFASFWPNHDDNPIGKAFNKAKKYVVTHRSDELSWRGSQRVGGDVASEIRALKASDGPQLHVWGSSELLQTLIAADLIDEHRLFIFPVVLGKGKRLFEPSVPPRRLSLVATRSTAHGVVLSTYRAAGPLP